MADRIIKGDSGNDVVIQNNSGSRKIEVTNSGDVEVTGDVKTTTVKATNLKANDGTASLEIADSTGDIGFTGNTNLKIKLPSAGGIYESDGSTPVLTESGGSVAIQNATFNGTIGNSSVINGVTDASEASAGNVGEFNETTGTGQTISTSTENMMTLTLTAGDWDLFASSEFNGSSASYMVIVLTTTSKGTTGILGKNKQNVDINSTTGLGQGFLRIRVNVNSGTTYYLTGSVNSGTGAWYNGYMAARRVR